MAYAGNSPLYCIVLQRNAEIHSTVEKCLMVLCCDFPGRTVTQLDGHHLWQDPTIFIRVIKAALV